MNSAKSGGVNWVSELAEFLRSQPGVSAVRIDTGAQRVAVATMGKVDLGSLEEKLAATIAGVEAPPVTTTDATAATAAATVATVSSVEMIPPFSSASRWASSASRNASRACSSFCSRSERAVVALAVAAWDCTVLRATCIVWRRLCRSPKTRAPGISGARRDVLA